MSEASMGTVGSEPLFRAVARALISVSDKTGVVELASSLARRGIALLSTGGTYRALRDAGIEVAEVSSHPGSPGIMAMITNTITVMP
ncbi:MAG: hypothetical protein ACO377_15350, partial [Pseudomonadales bacterium]